MSALAVFRAVGAVVTHRVHKLNNEANKTVLAGKEPHETLLTQQDRAAYLADHLQLAVSDVEELAAAVRERMALASPTRHRATGKFAESNARIDAALAKFEVRP